jgi:hypothetical protein
MVSGRLEALGFTYNGVSSTRKSSTIPLIKCSLLMSASASRRLARAIDSRRPKDKPARLHMYVQYGPGSGPQAGNSRISSGLGNQRDVATRLTCRDMHSSPLRCSFSPTRKQGFILFTHKCTPVQAFGLNITRDRIYPYRQQQVPNCSEGLRTSLPLR